MKKILFLTVIFACFQVETEASNNASHKKMTISETSSVSKTVGKRRRKKGFYGDYLRKMTAVVLNIDWLLVNSYLLLVIKKHWKLNLFH